MAHSNNSRALLDPVQANSALLHEPQHSSPQQQPSRPLQSPSIDYSILPTLWLPDDLGSIFAEGKYQESDRDRSPATFASPACLPSPPPTNSDPRRPIPLPALPSDADSIHNMSFPWSKNVASILDSPTIMTGSFLKTQPPPSPPPTVPLSSAELPPVMDDLSSVFGESFPVHDMLIDPSSRRLPSPLDAPLSPISPDLQPSKFATISSPESSLQARRRWEENMHVADAMERDHYAVSPLLHTSPSLAFWLHEDGLNDSDPFLYASDALREDDRNSSGYCKHIHGRLPLPSIPPLSFSSGERWPTPEDDPTHECCESETHHGLPLLEHDTLDHMDIDSKSPSESLSPPSPLETQQDTNVDSKCFPHLSSPLIRNGLSLISMDDEPKLFYHDMHSDDMPLSSPSPSLPRFSPLPDLEEEDLCVPMVAPPSSPGLSALSLPESDEDFDLCDIPLSTPNTYSRSLLLDDFDADTIPPRSPSPDIFTIDPAMLHDAADPELTALYELQRKAQAAEKAARAKEMAILEEEGCGPNASEARRAVKRKKAKAKELHNLLRLKVKEIEEAKCREREKGIDNDEFLSSSGLGITAAEEGSPRKKSSKPKITSIPQLVANMILSRHEPGPMSGRRLAALPSSSSTPKIRSPLGRLDTVDPETVSDNGDLGNLGLVGFSDMDS